MKKRWGLVLAVICLLLGACSAKPDNLENQAEQKEEIPESKTHKEWQLNQIELPDADKALDGIIPENGKSYGGKWGLSGEKIYRLIHISSSPDELTYAGSCVQILNPPYTSWENHYIAPEDWLEGKSCRPWIFTWSEYFSEDGVLHVLLQEQEGVSCIGRWSVEEGCSVTELESEQLQEEYFYDKVPDVWITDEEIGNYFLYRQWVPEMEYRSLWMDKDNREKTGVSQLSEGYVWQITYNPYSGETYLCGLLAEDVVIEGDSAIFPAGGFAIWKEGEDQPVFTSQDTYMTANNKIVFISETEGYLWNFGGIWKFSIKEQSIEKIFSVDMDVLEKMGGAWRGASVRNDGSFLMLSEGMYDVYEAGTCFLWELSEDILQEREETEKKELVLAVTFASAAYEQMARDFNMQSNDYRIVLRAAEKGEDLDDYRTRIQAEMAAGGGPDLLAADESVNLEAGARKGYLLDITEFFAEYENALLPSAWKTGQVDEKLYAIPYACSINTLVVSRDVVGDKKNWTLQEAMENMEQSKAVFFAGREDEAGLFYYLGLSTESNKKLVDWESGVSSLNSAEAEALLQFAVKYADHDSTPDNVAQRISDREGLAWLQYLYNVDAIKLAMAVFQNDEVYIGFPVQDGGSGHLMYGKLIAVNQACRDLEGARAFLEFLLSEEYQMQFAEKAASGSALSRPNGFPVQKEALEQFFNNLREEKDEPEGISAFGDFKYQDIPISGEQIDRLREVFFTARPASPRTGNLMPVIAEEMDDYISGNKSAGQVLDIIQNRVQLYLNEIL